MVSATCPGNLIWNPGWNPVKKTNKESVENHHAVKESEALLAAGSFNTLP